MTSRNIFKSVAILLIALTWTFSTYSQTILINAGHVIDPESGKVHDQYSIRIVNGKIEEIGSKVNLDNVDQIIDLSDSWILPGLMDCHVHITENIRYRSSEWHQQYIVESGAFRALRGAYNAELLLRSGFTTIKEIGNDANYVSADIIKGINKGWLQGPTIIYAGKIIAPYGGQISNVSPENEFFWLHDYIDADSPDEVKKAVRKNIYFGATTIKLVADQFNYYYDREEVEAAVREAAKGGLKVTAHVMGGEAARNVILGGAAGIEHGFELSNEELELMKEHGTYLIGTDFSYENWFSYGMDSATAVAYSEMVVDRLKRAYEVGVKMAFGTDIVLDIEGMNRVESNLEVLKTWKAAGIPPMYILKAMTADAADLMGIENDRGRLKPSLWADIIALKKNPLDDIENINSVHFVMKEGVVIRND